MFTEDFSVFFNPADFGQSATVGGATVSALFDDGYALGGAGALGMASHQPMLTLATAHVPADPVGTSVVVGGVNYTVGAHEPNGTGISRLMLEAA